MTTIIGPIEIDGNAERLEDLMQGLAATCIEIIPELNYTLDSLTILDDWIKTTPCKPLTLAAFGAYVGEVVRRQYPGFRWTTTSKLGLGNGSAAMTLVNDRGFLANVCWWPAKVMEDQFDTCHSKALALATLAAFVRTGTRGFVMPTTPAQRDLMYLKRHGQPVPPRTPRGTASREQREEWDALVRCAADELCEKLIRQEERELEEWLALLRTSEPAYRKRPNRAAQRYAATLQN